MDALGSVIDYLRNFPVKAPPSSRRFTLKNASIWQPIPSSPPPEACRQRLIARGLQILAEGKTCFIQRAFFLEKY